VANDILEPEKNPILSIKVLAELRSFGGLYEIVREFLAEAPMRIQAIQQDNAEKRFDPLALQAHALKGASGATGALRLSLLSAKIENAARSKSDGLLAELIAELVREFDIASEALLQTLADEPEPESELESEPESESESESE